MLQAPQGFDGWRQQARSLLASGVPPDDARWSDRREPSLFEDAPAVMHVDPSASRYRVPAKLLEMLELVAMHRDAMRWDLMYRLAWRAARDNPRLLEDAADPELRRAQQMAKAVRRDLHKMHAFVRFRKVQDEEGVERYLAWFEPDHFILARAAQFFVRRFGSMHWVISTPEGTALWDQRQLTLLDAPRRECVPREDELDPLWRTYYRSICNAARIRPAAMQREMPQKYWKLLPEAAEIGMLLRDSARRVTEFDDSVARALRERHAPIRSDGPDLPLAPEQRHGTLDACRRCALWERATQAVAGEGPQSSRLMLVGEQPGDEEDLKGRPFVGPAGHLLDEILREAGVDRGALYLTNAVKHFKWQPRGKRRIHKSPAQQEIAACQHWLLQELQQVKPAVVVALGATALQALTQRRETIEAARALHLQAADGSRLFATYHPAAILRAEPAQAAGLRAAMVNDLKRALEAAGSASADTPASAALASPRLPTIQP